MFLKGLGVSPEHSIYEWMDDCIQDGVSHAAVLEIIALGTQCFADVAHALMTGDQVPLEECVRVLADQKTRFVDNAYPIALCAGNLCAINTLIDYGVGPYNAINTACWNDALSANHTTAILKIHNHFPHVVPPEVLAVATVRDP